LAHALNDSDGDVREDAVRALGEIGSKSVEVRGVIKSYLSTVLEDSSYFVRTRTTTVLLRMNDNSARQELRKALKSSDLIIRRKAVLQLVELESFHFDFLTFELSTLLEDSDRDIRLAAMDLLIRSSNALSRSCLINALRNRDPLIQAKARLALGFEIRENLIETLLAYIRDPSFSKRVEARQILSDINDREWIIKRLIEELEREDEDTIQDRILESLFYICDPKYSKNEFPSRNQDSYIKELFKGLMSENTSKLRWKASDFLRSVFVDLLPTNLIEMLFEIFEDIVSEDLRLAAEIILRDIGGESVTDGFLDVLDHANDKVRSRAVINLHQIGGKAMAFGTLKFYGYLRRENLEENLTRLKDINASLIITGLLETLHHEEEPPCWLFAPIFKEFGTPLMLHQLWQWQLKIWSRGDIPPWGEVIPEIQNRCKFYNYEVWQELIQHTTSESQQPAQMGFTGQSPKFFPNATEVKIFERVEHYYENPPSTEEPP
jgi:HEAT repeat protein